MEPDSHYDRVTNYAREEAEKVKDIAKLPPPVRTVACVLTGQGVINNGGLHYFFESDFPNSPPYSFFVEAYRMIGANDAADALEKAVALFPFKDPQRHVDRRNKFLDSFK